MDFILMMLLSQAPDDDLNSARAVCERSTKSA